MKQFSKNIINILGALLVTIALITACSKLLEFKNSYIKNHDFITSDENFDVLFFGTSHVINGVIPMQLWGEQGISSYNLAGHAHSLATSYWAMKNALDYQKPRLVVIDADGLRKNDKLTNDSYMHESYDIYPLSKTKVEGILDLYSGGREKTSMRDFIFANSGDGEKTSIRDFIFANSGGREKTSTRDFIFANSGDGEKTSISDSIFANSGDGGKTSVADLIFSDSQEMDVKAMSGFLFKYSYYHTRWSDLEEKDFKPTVLPMNGAEFLGGTTKNEKRYPDVEPLLEETTSMVYLREIIKDCKTLGIDVLVTYLPSRVDDDEMAELLSAKQIANEEGVNFIDFIDLDIVDWDEDFDNSSHMNIKGATKVTKYLGEYIHKTYNIPDRRADINYDDFNKKYEEFINYREAFLNGEYDK